MVVFLTKALGDRRVGGAEQRVEGWGGGRSEEGTPQELLIFVVHCFGDLRLLMPEVVMFLPLKWIWPLILSVMVTSKENPRTKPTIQII